uniref:ATP synthase complex subunit 8 n=1 Tax=Lebbeus groenlandicus TaxID=397956 RepID=A0A649UDR0_9EUCA|nr:ATP synthase F0 subunit 8 [Lebbeus groenlandicus]QGI24745.1 ATP synthase F0 subunit 8 [Lebbeus groenlandicus]
MPQMAPLLWLPLFIFFSAIFLMFTAFNYSIKTPIKISNVSSTTLSHKLTWKW